MKVYVIVKGWESVGEGIIKVYYATWDGKCICTKQTHTDKIKEPSVKDYEKRDVHLEVLKQIYNQ